MKSSQKLKAKFLSAYYGNPIKDMKLIIVATPNYQSTTAHFVHEIFKSAHKSVAILASDHPFSMSALHKFLSDAWQAGADYVVVTTPSKTIEEDIFNSLPIYYSLEIDQTKPLFPNAERIISNSNAKLLNSKSYKKGTELTLAFGSDIINLATFATGESAIPSVIAATTLAHALNLPTDAIIDGIANYDN